MVTFLFYNSTESSTVRSLTSDSPDGFTLVLNWQPPDSPNGDILNYIVRITQQSDGVRISEQDVRNITFTATNLSEFDLSDNITSSAKCVSGEGVPYNVSITPVNLAGPGIVKRVTLFTKELSK